MDNKYSRYIHIIHFLGDVLFLNLAFLVAFYMKFDRVLTVQDEKYLSLLSFLNIFWILVVFVVRLYDIYRVTRIEKIILNLLRALGLQILLIFSFIVIQKGYTLSRELLMLTFLIFGPVLFGWRLLVLYMLSVYRKAGYNFRRVVIVGCGPVGKELQKFFESDLSYGYHFVGFFDKSQDDCLSPDKFLGEIGEIKSFCRRENIDEIYCAMPLHETNIIRDLMAFSENNLIRFKIVPDFRAFEMRRVGIDFYNNIPVMIMRNEPLENVVFRFVKRCFDVAFSSLVLVGVCSWLFPLIAILVKLDSKGPVFFRQKRTGKDNKEFWCYKFRSMLVNDDAHHVQATKGDSRITRVGAFLRKTSLDEFPQFYNVLKGDMSVVGPRPHMLNHTKEYATIVDKFMVRHLIKPGITGLSQVLGYRGETETPEMMENRVKTDVYYIENWSMVMDLKIIVKTVLNMVRGDENAY
ncbi:MAG: undecaprenyl-phosphate glucose phosphotransferase [Flavobacteriales bacterium]|nr:undecaprenyl-phosphate glucose phosphotransferase [Flavobacteriales bacterium]MCB9447423.1 undecaprenyl-phosphate glucose phosphotransferase [Flavobacteriales bacterium]